MSEQRLIDANALDSALLTEGLASALIGYPHRRTLTVGEIRGILQKAPTVPAEVVVHCKDCEYKAKAKVNQKGFLVCPASRMEISDDDYCSYGERRESEAGK